MLSEQRLPSTATTGAEQLANAIGYTRGQQAIAPPIP